MINVSPCPMSSITSDNCDQIAFIIQCTIRRPDGSHSPFTIPSTISFLVLRDLVAEKLGRFPSLVQLRYKLDSKKTKDGLISIQDDSEFAMFKDRLCPLIVPPRLASGKPSTRQLKPVIVYFEDGGAEELAGNKGVRTLHTT